jgi:hypothetical protein
MDLPINSGIIHDYGAIDESLNKSAFYTSFHSKTTFFLDYDSHLKVFRYFTASKEISFDGIPSPGVSCGTRNQFYQYSCPFYIFNGGIIELREDTAENVKVQSVTVYLDGKRYANPRPILKNISSSVLSFRSIDGGYSWKYAGVILAASMIPESEEGPNENDLVLLSDGVTILCVIRQDAGDGVYRRYAPYVSTRSHDGGFNWEVYSELPYGVGSARPRLLSFGSTIILSGGRPSRTSEEIMLWINKAGDGIIWDPISVSYWHNYLAPFGMPLFPKQINKSNVTLSQRRVSTSYTSLIPTSNSSGIIIYGLIENPGTKFQLGTGFSLAFELYES